MTQTDLDPYGTMAEEAKARMREWANRSGGQHMRAVRKSWAVNQENLKPSSRLPTTGSKPSLEEIGNAAPIESWGTSSISSIEYQEAQEAKNRGLRLMLDSMNVGMGPGWSDSLTKRRST